MTLKHTNLLVIRVHGPNPLTQTLTGCGSKLDLVRVKVRVGRVFGADGLHVSHRDVIFVVIVQGFQEFHVTEKFLTGPPEVFNLFARSRGVRDTLRLDT